MLQLDKGALEFIAALFLTTLQGCTVDFKTNKQRDTDTNQSLEDGSDAEWLFSSPTPDISVPNSCFAPSADIVVRIHNPSSNPSMDWIWVPDDNDWWTYLTGSEYHYTAPGKSGSYEMRFYWNDAEDKDWRSKLTFHVKDSCP